MQLSCSLATPDKMADSNSKQNTKMMPRLDRKRQLREKCFEMRKKKTAKVVGLPGDQNEDIGSQDIFIEEEEELPFEMQSSLSDYVNSLPDRDRKMIALLFVHYLSEVKTRPLLLDSAAEIASNMTGLCSRTIMSARREYIKNKGAFDLDNRGSYERRTPMCLAMRDEAIKLKALSWCRSNCYRKGKLKCYLIFFHLHNSQKMMSNYLTSWLRHD